MTLLAMVLVAVIGIVWLLICQMGISAAEKSMVVDYMGVGLAMWTLAFCVGAVLITATLLMLAFG